MMVWAAPLDYDWTYRLKQACIKTKQKKTKHSQQVKTILGDHLVFEVKLPRTTGTEGGRGFLVFGNCTISNVLEHWYELC